ncbi:ATP-binding protein [Phytohabitans houttuyneae]|uniref:ATP-binding protein n=1 Tax=Phytohabitans houttuyneae TaxID=1076126 RepID=UPI00156685E0|nr:ATP-binding protein [Phytohabitans houttuyneae]
MTGLLSVYVRNTPRELLEHGHSASSPWSGMSGGPVVTSDGLLLGVVFEHRPREGQSTIKAVPITAIEPDLEYPRWGAGVIDAAAWWSRLGVTGIADLSAVPTAGSRQVVAGLPDYVPSRVRDREGERGALRALVTGQESVLSELRGPAGVGKTALAAEVAREFPGRAAFLTATGYSGVTVTTVLDALAEMVADGTKRELLKAQLRVPQADPLTRLDDVLVALAAGPVLLVVDEAQELLKPDGQLHDEGIAAMFTEIAHSRGRSVRVLFVTTSPVGTRTTPRIRLPSADPVRLDGGLPPQEYNGFVSDLISARRDQVQALPIPELERMTGRHPRRTEILVGIPHGPDLDRAADAHRLADVVMASLVPDQARTVEALAVCRRPVDAKAAAHLAGLTRDDARQILDELANRRIVREHGGLYHVPNDEARSVLRRLGPAVVAGHTKRAASYFEAEARRAHPASLDDCVDWFNAIALHIAAGDPERALSVIEDVDERHLREWGHSDALLPWLREVSNKLTDTRDKVCHGSLLARALAQYGRLDDGIAEVIKAGRLNVEMKDSQRQVALLLQLAGYLFRAGRIRLAAQQYKDAAGRACDDHRPGNAESIAGLALCDAQTGRFDAALRHIDAARHNLAIRRQHDHDIQLLHVRLDYNQALVELELGDDTRSSESVGRARAAADGLDATPLLARCDDLEARIMLYRQQPEDALPLATAACEIAARIGGPELARIAGATYATVLLRLRRFPEALIASHSAARFKRSFFVAEALAIEGVAAFRIDNTGDRARAAFTQAIGFAEKLLQQEWHNYRAWEAAAIAQVGLALMDEATDSWQAEHAYQRAIEGSSNKLGGRHRRRELFDILTAGRPATILTRIRQLLA